MREQPDSPASPAAIRTDNKKYRDLSRRISRRIFCILACSCNIRQQRHKPDSHQVPDGERILGLFFITAQYLVLVKRHRNDQNSALLELIEQLLQRLPARGSRANNTVERRLFRPALHAVTGNRRAEAVPDVPTIAESGVTGYAATNWYGLLAPAKTPPAIVDRLNAEINRVLPSLRERYAELGTELVGGSPAEFRTFIASELDKWARVVKASGAKPE
mgnify:CR=1 FL=1